MHRHACADQCGARRESTVLFLATMSVLYCIKLEADSLVSLRPAVSSEDSIQAKKAFVASATALKDLADAVGLTGSLKGL